jgi:ABC-type enterochelin transport system substrate-binding protein
MTTNSRNNILNMQTDLESRITQLEAAQAELKALKAERKASLRIKVSPKGAVSVYGLNSRFPLTLYANQWERLIVEMIDTNAIYDFISENDGELSRK